MDEQPTIATYKGWLDTIIGMYESKVRSLDRDIHQMKSEIVNFETEQQGAKRWIERLTEIRDSLGGESG